MVMFVCEENSCEILEKRVFSVDSRIQKTARSYQLLTCDCSLYCAGPGRLRIGRRARAHTFVRPVNVLRVPYMQSLFSF